MQLQCSYGPARMRSTVSVRAQAAATPAAAPGVASSGPRKSLVKLLTGEATDRRQRRMLQEPAGPAFMPPLIGETPDFLEKGALKFGLERLVKYGPLFRTSVFGADLVMVADPDLYKAMMQEDSKLVNFSLQGTMNKLMTNFGKKFLSNEDNSRMPMRRIMLPSVTQEAMAGYLPKMNDISRNLVDGWSKLPEWDVSEESRKAAMQFANSLLAGIELDGEEDEKQLRQLLATYFDGMTTYDIDLPGTTLRKALDAYAILQKRVYATVAPQVEAIMAEPQVEPGQRVRKNLLGYLIDGQRAVGMEIKTQDVADMALGVLQAGTDTSSAGLASLLAVLVQRPDIWKRLQDEQRQAIAKYGPNITKEYMDSCKVLDAAVREAARFMPPATLQTRTALVDFQLGPYLIKKGTFLMVNTSTCQAIESEPSWIVKAKMARAEGQPMPLPLGADITRIAQGFSLDRWLSNDPKDRPPLFTFSHGPHTCLGIAIFVQEAKSLLAHMVREYDLQLATEVSWVSMPMLKPGPGTRMRLRRLEQPLTATAAA